MCGANSDFVHLVLVWITLCCFVFNFRLTRLGRGLVAVSFLSRGGSCALSYAWTPRSRVVGIPWCPPSYPQFRLNVFESFLPYFRFLQFYKYNIRQCFVFHVFSLVCFAVSSSLDITRSAALFVSYMLNLFCQALHLSTLLNIRSPCGLPEEP